MSAPGTESRNDVLSWKARGSDFYNTLGNGTGVDATGVAPYTAVRRWSMSIGTMTSKGQITVPKDVRLALGLAAGVSVSFTRNSEGDFVIRVANKPAADLAGALKYAGPPLSLSEMDDAITAGAMGL